jgi:hypothetical protein
MIAILTGATTAALIVPAFTTATPVNALTALTSQAAPADPVSALKAQFVAGRGVKVLEGNRTSSGGELLTAQKRRGVLQLGPSGMTGYDILTGSNLPGETAKPVRDLAVSGNLYRSGGIIAGLLPEGKAWTGTSAKISALSPFLTPVLVLEPTTLASLLSTSTAKAAGARLHKGTVTFGTLYRVSPSYRASLGKRRLSAAVAAMKVNWQLWIGADKLPIRLVTSWVEPPAGMRVTRVSDVRFASWGTPVTLAAPPAEETAR